MFLASLVGLYFFDGALNAGNYLELLIDLKEKLENNPELQDIEHFQQDGAPPY